MANRNSAPVRPASIHVIALASLVCIWVLFFWRYFIPGAGRVSFPAGDFTYQFFIFRDIAYRALAAGHLPLWADCLFAGYPFQADPQSQLFYPPIWLEFISLKALGWGNFPILALTIETTTHYLLASCLMFELLVGEMSHYLPETPKPVMHAGALVGSIAFSYGGYLTGYPPLQTAILETVTWLPLILLLLGKLAVMPADNPWWPAAGTLCALALSAAFFAGHPQTFLYVAYLAVAYFVYRARSAGLSAVGLAMRLVLVLGLVAGLTLAQLLPQFEYLLLSTRSTLSFAELSHGFPTGIIFQFFFTDPIWSPLYVGILPLALGALAVACFRKGPIIFWIGAALLGLVLSLGGATPLYGLAYWIIPGYSLFRDQERLAMVVSFSIAMLSGYGVVSLLTSSKIQKKAGGIFLVISILAAAASWMSYSPDSASWAPRAWLMVIAVGLSGFGFAAALMPFVTRRQAALLLIGVTTVNLGLARTSTNAVADFDPYPYQPFLEPIRADPELFFRVQDDARMQGHFACGYGLREWSGITPIRPANWVSFDDKVPEVTRWKLLGTKYLITWKNGAITREGALPPAEKVAEGLAPNGVAKVYRLFEIPRRAWLVYDVQVQPNGPRLYSQIGAAGFDPFSQAVLTAPSDVPLPLTGAPTDGQVEVLEDWPGHLSLRVTTRQPALLVISEAYYPGWQATVSGQTEPAMEADGFVQSVWVPAGQSDVVLEFRPWLLVAGAILSIGTAMAALLLAGTSQTRRYFRPASPMKAGNA
jgi:hypothetical protein